MNHGRILYKQELFNSFRIFSEKKSHSQIADKICQDYERDLDRHFTEQIAFQIQSALGFYRSEDSNPHSLVSFSEEADQVDPSRQKIVIAANIREFEIPALLNNQFSKIQLWKASVTLFQNVISSVGLNPRYTKSDQSDCGVTIRQYLLDSIEDGVREYVVFNLKWICPTVRKKMVEDYLNDLDRVDLQISQIQKKLSSWFLSAKTKKALHQRIEYLNQERDAYLKSNPDPREYKNGLLLTVSCNFPRKNKSIKPKIKSLVHQYITALGELIGNEIESALKQYNQDDRQDHNPGHSPDGSQDDSQSHNEEDGEWFHDGQYSSWGVSA